MFRPGEPELHPLMERPASRIHFLFPEGLRGTAALMEKDRIFAADIDGDEKGPFFKVIAESRIDPDEERSFPHPERLCDSLSNLLESRNLPREDLILSLPNTLFSLEVLPFPDLGRKNLEASILNRIRKKMGKGDEEETWRYEIIERKRMNSVCANQLLVARIRDSWLSRLRSSLEEHGIEARVIAPTLAGVMRLMDCVNMTGEEESILTVEVSSHDAALSLFRGRILQQFRRLEEGDLTDWDRLNDILHQALQSAQALHKGRYRGRGIKKAVFLGSHAGCVDVGRIKLTLDVEPTNLVRNHGNFTAMESRTLEGLLGLMTGLVLHKEKLRRHADRNMRARIDFTAPPAPQPLWRRLIG